jgi:phosphate transport system substrate-binding protein
MKTYEPNYFACLQQAGRGVGNLNRKKAFIFILILALWSISSCDYTKHRSVTTIGDYTIAVDESISPVIKKEADEFMRLNKDARITMNIKTSNEVMADLINGDIKTVVVSRDYNQQEKELIEKYKIEIKKNKLALDGIGVVVNPANPVEKLDYIELRKIFTGEANDWKDLSGDSKSLYKGKIKVFIARKNAAPHDIFKEQVLAGKEYAKTDVVCSTSVQMVNEVKSNSGSIGFVTMSWITKFADTLDTMIKPLKIAPVDSSGHVGDYVGLHQAYIADRSYPLVFEIYVLSRDFDMNVSIGFISFLLAYDGQKIVLNSGLVPVTQPVRIIQLN